MRFSIITMALFFACISCKESNERIMEDKPTDVVEVEMTEAEKIANAYGYDKWDNVEEIQFTFNVGSDEGQPFKRHWVWKPKSGDVTMMTAQDTITYNRKSVDSMSLKADQAFINDKYWLLTPFQMVWDEGTTLSEPIKTETPMDSTMMNKVTLTYGEEGGYTPGDAYDFYYGDDFKVKQWVFRKGNDSIASMTTTWENEQTINGITFAKDHKMPGRNIYFTDVKIKMSEL